METTPLLLSSKKEDASSSPNHQEERIDDSSAPTKKLSANKNNRRGLADSLSSTSIGRGNLRFNMRNSNSNRRHSSDSKISPSVFTIQSFLLNEILSMSIITPPPAALAKMMPTIQNEAISKEQVSATSAV
jgi:hypothetical protein